MFASPPALNGEDVGAWLDCAPLSLWPAMLFPSSSVNVVSAMLGGGADSGPPFFIALVAFICWISNVICSVFMASRMAVVAEGRRARTVNVQSS